MLAKLGLGVGYKLLGDAFRRSDYAKTLRWGMREANAEKRRLIPVRGSPLFGGPGLGGAEEILKWPGGWVLVVMIIEGSLGLLIISPSGRSMSVLVCNDQNLIADLDPNYVDGVVWITGPPRLRRLARFRCLHILRIKRIQCHRHLSWRLPPNAEIVQVSQVAVRQD